MTRNFDWIPDDGLKTEIIQAWEDYQRHPEVWRLNHYLALISEVPIDENLDNIKYEDPKYAVCFGDTHQPSLLDCW